MRGLCRELGLSFQQEVKPLTSQEAYSNKIGELLKHKKEKKAHSSSGESVPMMWQTCTRPLWLAVRLADCLPAC